MKVRYCPACRSRLDHSANSRFAECPEHGKLLVTVSEVNS